MLFNQVIEQPFLTNTTRTDSRYGLTKVTIDQVVREGTRRFGLWQRPDISTDEAARHVVGPGEVGRIDLIAYKYYNNVNFWWAIASVNSIKNPLTDLVPGDTLLIPTKSAIMEALAVRQTQG